MHGILLFAHGARDPAWARPFETIAAHMRAAAPAQPVALAYLELMRPSMAEAAVALAAEGCTDITVVPLFLGAGGHVRRDLPELIAALHERLPTVTIRATAAIGETDVVTRAIASAALSLVAASHDTGTSP